MLNFGASKPRVRGGPGPRAPPPPGSAAVQVSSGEHPFSSTVSIFRESFWGSTTTRGQQQQSIRNVPADQPSPPPCDASKVQPPPSPPGTPSGGHQHQHQHQPTRSLGARNRQKHWQIVVHNFEGGKSVKAKKIL